jgi:hypothetical protein
MLQTLDRHLKKSRSRFISTMAADTLVRAPGLLTA